MLRRVLILTLTFAPWVIFVLALLFCATGCATGVKSRPVLGMLGRQCAQSAREVYCQAKVADSDCDLLAESVGWVNHVYKNVEFYRYMGRTNETVLTGSNPNNLIVEYSPKIHRLVPGKATALAVTILSSSYATGCIIYVGIEIFVVAGDISTPSRVNMLRHELLHALGLPHADEHDDSGLMCPINSGADFFEREVSEREWNALDATYAGSW